MTTATQTRKDIEARILAGKLYGGMGERFVGLSTEQLQAEKKQLARNLADAERQEAAALTQDQADHARIATNLIPCDQHIVEMLLSAE